MRVDFFEERRPRRIVPRMLAKGAGDTKDVTRTREKDASLNRRGRDSPEATWIRPRLLLKEPLEAVAAMREAAKASPVGSRGVSL